LEGLPDAIRQAPRKAFLFALSDEDRASIVAAMKEVRTSGLVAARHLRREIYEVRADGKDVTYRILFAAEGKRGQVLLALHGFEKKTRKTPPTLIELAESRLRDWRERGRGRSRRGGR
jgi:phage-related protein